MRERHVGAPGPDMAVGESEIQEAAEGLVVRHGRNAVSVAKELVDVLEKQRNQPELDTALRVLAAVERLVDTEDSTGT